MVRVGSKSIFLRLLVPLVVFLLSYSMAGGRSGCKVDLGGVPGGFSYACYAEQSLFDLGGLSLLYGSEVSGWSGRGPLLYPYVGLLVSPPAGPVWVYLDFGYVLELPGTSGSRTPRLRFMFGYYW